MLFKLSIKNIKQSIKDYSIYFFTLVFAVAIFYIFNSLDAQSSMLVLNDSKIEIVKVLIEVLGYVSVFVSIVLAFLIIYSNNFLIKRRKKEIGLYFTLGMSKQKVSSILVLETFIIGIISLICGLLFGVGLSQFLSIFVAKLFEADLSNLKFVFSTSAFGKTILYFGIIFLLVMIFSVISLNRYKLIDLKNASKKNEKIKIRNKYVTIFTFLLSVLLLAYAYYLLFDNVLVMMDYRTIVMLVSGAIGTFLLFYSCAGFLLKVVQKIKRIYYSNLNMFTLKQVNNKINTTIISTTVTCLMLLLTIGVLSCALSLAKVFNNGIKENNLTDFTIEKYDYYENIQEEIKSEEYENEFYSKISYLTSNKEFNKYVKEYAVINNYYDQNLTTKNLLTKDAINELKREYGSSISFDFNIPIIKESEYKQLANIQKKDAIDIKSGKYLLMVNIDFIADAYKEFYENDGKIVINGQTLMPASTEIIDGVIKNSAVDSNDGVIIVEDKVLDGLEPIRTSIIGNLYSDTPENERKLFNFFSESGIGGYSYSSRIGSMESSISTKCLMIFVGLYLGVLFAISSATILAIGQLSESNDNKERYRILRQLGADNKMINKALFTQVLIVFIFPLLVALIHSYFGLKEINSLIVSIGNIDLTSNILLTTLFMIIIYGGYFLLTYLCSKNIIKEK